MGYIERERKKFEQIYQECKDDVYRVCLYFTKDANIAQEMAQQTFFNFYKHIDQVEADLARSYLVRTARNLCFNYTRDKKYEQMRDSWDTLSEESAAIVSVEEVFFRNEQKKQKEIFSKSILESLKEENEDWYTAVNLLYCLGKPHEVVADELGISKDALYSLVYRAKKWIRKTYEQKYEEIMKRS